MTPTDAGNRSACTAQWVIALLLAVIATALWLRPDGLGLPVASAQNPPMAGARGVYAFTGQFDHNKYGLFMLDVDQGTIWCYELQESAGTHKLRLAAARSWVYDRFLQDFNCEKPDFRMVQELVAQQRSQSAGGARPASEETANKPAGTSERSPRE
jgi:hypothetical protein